MTNYRIVPVEPTEAMWLVGCSAEGTCERTGECHMDCQHSEPVRMIWHGMITVAPDPTEDAALVERVAAALYETDGQPDPDYNKLARAALKAIQEGIGL